MRSAMLETISSDFIRTAVAKGASSRAVIWKHAFRNSLLPIITISAGILPELVAGAIIIESIFTIPGMGDLTFRAILNRDYPVINAVLFLSAFLTLLGILLADLAYSIADPRIDYR
jgi:peptide/nickel transport system permease protein